MTREEEIYNQSVGLFSAVDKQPKNFEGVYSKRQLNIAKEAEERYLSSPLHQYYSAEDLVKSFRDGAEWADMHPYWRPSTEHPPVDVEVVALEGKYLRVCFAHIVKDKKNVIDFNGWNIPDIRWWMPIQDITEIKEDEEVE